MKKIGLLLTGRPALTLDASVTVLEAARAMKEQRVGAVLVVRGEGEPAGIFTERDLMVRIVVPGLDPASERLGDHATREVFTVSPERVVSDVAREMQRRHIRHLPVVQGHRVLGILSLRDLLRELLAQKTGEVDALTAYIQGEGAAEA